MKIAALGDVHANLHALDAVLDHAKNEGVDEIWNIGDFTGYGAFPDEVVTRLREINAVSILGNYDRKVLKLLKKENRWKKSKNPVKLLAFRWAYENLSPANRSYLSSLPQEYHQTVEGWDILMVHGSPASQIEHLTPDTPQERFAELAGLTSAGVIICGHSHQPFTHRVNNTWFINTGSVGRPDDGDPRACYALLQFTPGELSVSHYRIDYNVEAAAQSIRSKGLPEFFARMLLEGRNLDVVQEGHSQEE